MGAVGSNARNVRSGSLGSPGLLAASPSSAGNTGRHASSQNSAGVNERSNSLPGVRPAAPSTSSSGGTTQAPSCTTIKNDMHLKKASLTCFQDAAAPNVVRLSFQVDTNCACMMHVYYNAEESFERGGALKFTGGSRAIEPIPLPKGLHQKCVLAPEQCIDYTKLSAKELFLLPTAERDARRFPLVIHLVNIPPDQRSSKSPLNGLQSQTTFATFVKRSENEIGIKVIKQKIQIPSAKVYELHEIYGISQLTDDAAMASLMPAEKEQNKECVICMSAPRDTTVLPCRHMCMCNECAQVLRYQSSKCPICRCTVESLLQIKVSKRAPNRMNSGAQAAASAHAASGSSSASASTAHRPPAETLQTS